MFGSLHACFLGLVSAYHYVRTLEWSHRRAALVFGVPVCVTVVLLLHQMHDVFLFTPCLWIVSVVLVVNFPEVAPSLHKHPIYLGDIKLDEAGEAVAPSGVEIREQKRRFYGYFHLMVNLSFACLLTGFFDYAYFILTKAEHPESYIQIMGVIGGVLSLWGSAQQLAGRILLKVCYITQKWKESRENKQRLSQFVTLDLLTEPSESEVAYIIGKRQHVEEFLGV